MNSILGKRAGAGHLYSYDWMQDMVLCNNKDIHVGGKPVFIREWFDSNILSIQDLLNSNGQLLSCQEFNNTYACNTNFVQVTSAVPKYLVIKARSTEPPESELHKYNWKKQKLET